MLNSLSKLIDRLTGRPGRRLLRDERGVTAVEFGLLALPFFTLIGGILQTSIIFLATQVMESAVYDAARLIRTGQIQQSGGDIETFRSRVCDRLYGLFPDCAGLHIRVTEVSNFRSASVTPPVDTECTLLCDWTTTEIWTPGAGRKVMLVQVYYRYPVLLQFGPLGMANLADGTRLLGTASVFETEPF
jgi:Flp pilus assembly protein TadG